jgi:hypothetical protein
VLLLDELTAHLDLRHRAVVLERVAEFARAGGAAPVVSHDHARRACCGRPRCSPTARLRRAAPRRGLTPRVAHACSASRQKSSMHPTVRRS